MKEIGGYFELDNYNNPMLHEGAIALNCGRNALAYLIEANNIKKIYLPYFLCSSVKEVCKKYNIEIQYYNISADFRPLIDKVDTEAWFYLVNFYGQLNEKILQQYINIIPNVILDNAHNYFAAPFKEISTIYTCRKYFGVADGAFLYTNNKIKRKLQQDESFERIKFVLGRYERPASEFYKDSVMNNKIFTSEPIKEMSKLTNNLLHGLNYLEIKEKRTKNYNFLFSKLEKENALKLRRISGPYMYPFLPKDQKKSAYFRKKLLDNKIYIPTLWPNVLEEVPKEWLEWNYANNILPLPCDQRYGENEMAIMVDIIQGKGM